MSDNRVVTVPFSGTVLAGSTKVLSCPLITTPFEVLRIMTSFPLNTNRTVQQEFYISEDNDEPTSGKPSGINILAEYGQVGYVVGDDEQKILHTSAVQETGNSYLKVYANNTDSFSHTIDVIITIKILPRR